MYVSFEVADDVVYDRQPGIIVRGIEDSSVETVPTLKPSPCPVPPTGANMGCLVIAVDTEALISGTRAIYRDPYRTLAMTAALACHDEGRLVGTAPTQRPPPL
jgi:hypothetical protein